MVRKSCGWLSNEIPIGFQKLASSTHILKIYPRMKEIFFESILLFLNQFYSTENYLILDKKHCLSLISTFF